jgi:hypothetical protein
LVTEIRILKRAEESERSTAGRFAHANVCGERMVVTREVESITEPGG